MDVIVVCHTEFGEVRDNKVIAIKEHSGATLGVDALHKIAKRHGAKVTLAVCPEVAEYIATGDSEIGLHVHPGWEQFEAKGRSWFAGDEYLRKYYRHGDSTVLRDYTLDQQLDMIAGAQFKLARVFGIVPKTFVAGRWSLNSDTMTVLERLGITHDCSAVAGRKEEHYDWSRLPRVCSPYHPDEEDYQASGEMKLTEVPIAQLCIGGNVNPELSWLLSAERLKLAFMEYAISKEPVFHICLHSPAMLSPRFGRVLDELLRFIASAPGVQFKYASEIMVR